MTPKTRRDQGKRAPKQAAGSPAERSAASGPGASFEDDERFRILSTLASDFAYAFAVAPDGTLELEWMTEAFARITGYQPEEVWPAGNWLVLIHPEDQAVVMERMAHVMAGEPDEGEARIIARDGTVRWLHIHTQPVLDPAQQRVVRVYGAVRDIDERKRAEAALRESEDRYRTLAESAPDAIFIINREGRLDYVNQAAARVLHSAPEQVVGRLPEEFFAPGAFARQRRNLQAVFQSGEPAFFLGDTWVGDQQIWQETSLIPLEGDTGEVRAVMGISRDVTDRMHAEEALRESEERYRTLAESTPDAIYIINREGRVEYVNRAAARLVSRELTEIVGESPEAFFAPGDFSRQAQNLQHVLQAGQPLAVESRNVIAGIELWQDSLLVPLKAKDGQVRAIMGVSRDITWRKRTEEALRSTQQLLSVILNSMSEVVAYLDPERRIIWANRAAADSVGMAVEQLVGRHCYELWGPDRALCPWCPVQDTLRTGQGHEAEAVYPDGRTWHIRSYPVYGTEEEVVGVVDVAQDVTARRQAEEALRQSEHQYRTTIDSMHDLIHVVDSDLRILLSNTAMQQRLEEMHLDTTVTGRSVFDVFPFLPERVRDEYRHVFETGETLLTEESTRVGKEEFVTETRKIPVLEDDKVVRVITMIHDVSQRRRDEQALRESEERYRAVVEDQTELISRMRPDWTITFVNEAYCRYFGQSREQLLGQDLRQHLASTDPERIQQHIAALSQEQPEAMYEDSFLLPTGQVRWQQWTDRAIFDERGQMVEVQSVGRDITRRKQAEAALRESEARYRALVETSPDAITLTDLEGNILVTNQRGAEIHGYASPAEMIGKNAFDMTLPSDREAAITNLQRALESGQVRNVEYTIRRGDGALCPIELSASLIYDDQGRPQAFIGVTRDITERKRAEEALWQTKMVVEHSPVILYRVRNEPGWPVAFISENVQQLGYTAEELLSGQATFTMLVHPDDLPRVLAEMEEHAEQGPDIFRRSYRVVLKNGQVAWVEDRVVVVRAPGGQATHFQGILLDITETRQLEEQFRQAQKMETVGRLAGGIAHDFNNFLTAIRGYAGLVCDSLRPEDPVRADIEQVLKAAERAAGLTGQLLAFSRRQIIEPRPVNLNDLVMETEKMLHRLISEDIDLVLDLTTTLKLTRADPGQITQALVNLVVNARDAMPDGGMLTIATANLDLDQEMPDEHPGVPPGSFATLTVSDTGVGMSPEVQMHLFEPFFTTKEAGRGTGLGLATVYGIIHQHQGYITVRSEAGHGTTVRIYLPHLQERVRPAPRRGPATPMPRGNETVLVVEDEPAVRALMVRVLRSVGYNVLEAGEGNTAIQVARGHAGKIDLLLTDVVMPQMDGRMLASLLQDAYEGLRVLYVSGYATDVLSRYGILEEGVNLLHKPFTGATLAGKVREVLDGGGETKRE